MRIVLITFLGVLGIAVAGCDVPGPRSILPQRCMTIGGAEPVSVAIRVPADGTVRVGIEPRGIAVVASVSTPSGMPVRATSPVDRLGLITLVSPARAGKTIVVRMESRDWRDIHADVCIDAELLGRSDIRRVRAERAFAQAGAATHERDWQRAFDSYGRAARGFARLGLDELSGAARHAMGELAYMRLHREDDALSYVNEARSAYANIGDAVTLGTLAALEARAAVEVRDVSVATELAAVQRMIDSARELLSAAPRGSREAFRLTVLEGFLAYYASSPEHAASFFERAMRECRAAHDWECHGTAGQNVALLAEEGRNYGVALKAYQETLRFLDAHIAPEQTADVSDNLGRLQRVIGLVSLSERSHATALRLYVGLKDCDSARRTLARIGALHTQIGSVDDAATELQRAATLGCDALFAAMDPDASPKDDGPPADACSGLIAPDALSADGRFAVLQAILALKENLQLAGNLDGAERCIARATFYASTARDQLRAANARGALLLERGKATDASAAFEEARRVADEAAIPLTYEHRGRTLLGLARARLSEGDATAGQQIALKALAASSARGDVAQVVESLQVLAAVFLGLHKPDHAARTLQVAIELIERVPIQELDGDVRATYLAAQHAVFAELTALLAGTARTDDEAWTAFDIAESGRARSLKYALSQASVRSELANAGAIAAPYDDLLEDISAVAADVDRLQRMADQTPRLLRHGERRALLGRLLELDAVLVQYAAGPHEMFVFVIDAAGIHVLRLGDRETIARASNELLEKLRDPEATRSDVRTASRALAERVWWPVARWVERKRVILAPDDMLHLVPFGLLPWSADSDTHLVVNRVETTIVPAASFIGSGVKSLHGAGGARRLTLIGDPVFRSTQWQRECTTARAANEVAGNAWTEWLPSLPGTRDEVLAIAELAQKARPDSRVQTLLGCAATLEALRRAARERATVLHIATHGRIDARRPRLSALALTPDAREPQDAAFGLLDILDLDLETRLVTLSACDTSRGRLLDGEGVLGPTQAFLQAGAASVVASFWRVEDATTARFMREFYKRLLNENMSTGEALRASQLQEQSRGASYAWAAFALYGRPDTRI